MKTTLPPKSPIQLELALDYKQPSLIRQFAKEAIKDYLKKEAQMLTFDGSVDLVEFIHQREPEIKIVANGRFTIQFNQVISQPKAIKVTYKGKEYKL